MTRMPIALGMMALLLVACGSKARQSTTEADAAAERLNAAAARAEAAADRADAAADRVEALYRKQLRK